MAPWPAWTPAACRPECSSSLAMRSSRICRRNREVRSVTPRLPFRSRAGEPWRPIRISVVKQRLDHLLVSRGLCDSREQGKRLILAGEVLVNEEPITKAGQLIAEDAAIRVKRPPKFVSRGGFKLEGALDHFGIFVEG